MFIGSRYSSIIPLCICVFITYEMLKDLSYTMLDNTFRILIEHENVGQPLHLGIKKRPGAAYPDYCINKTLNKTKFINIRYAALIIEIQPFVGFSLP